MASVPPLAIGLNISFLIRINSSLYTLRMWFSGRSDEKSIEVPLIPRVGVQIQMLQTFEASMELEDIAETKMYIQWHKRN